MILKTDNQLRFGIDFELIDNIPVGNWLLMFDDLRKEYYLEKLADFIIPSKIYGNDEELVDRYLETFKNSEGNMGVWFSGLKGNGKSVIAKMISKKSNLPTVMITQPFVGEDFQGFLANISQEIVVMLDEFEKVYKDEKQEEFLHILDGIFQNKKLFIFTTNSTDINPYLKSRPSRIRYHKEYNGLDDKVVEEIIEDLLKNKDHKRDLMEIVWVLGSISMDILLTLIDEMNKYNESPREAIDKLNIQIEHEEYSVLMFINGKRRESTVRYNPLNTRYIWLSYQEDIDKENSRIRYYEKSCEELTFEVIEGNIEAKDREGNKLIFTPIKSKKIKF